MWGRRDGRCARGCGLLESALEVEAYPTESVSPLLELNASLSDSDEASELVEELA